MKTILRYVGTYFSGLDKRVFVLSALFIALAIFTNYYYGLNRRISTFSFSLQYLSWFFLFLAAFSFPYLLTTFFRTAKLIRRPAFVLLLLSGPALFAWKMSADISFRFSDSQLLNSYWNQVLYWPFKLVVMTLALWIIWKLTEPAQPFYGVTVKQFQAKPYFIMLLVMVPLIAAASTQPDFLAVYPKLKNIGYLAEQENTGWHTLLYEVSYGSDFFSIELFFRGFLVLGFVRFAGKDAILPMACFYCIIHFGKPLGECISSFFGGLILGAVTYHTRSIFGGLIVHLGIAWLMELGGYIGNSLR